MESLELRELMATDVVLGWNETLLAAIRTASTAPPIASRAMAIVHISIYDAANAIDRTGAPYGVDLLASPLASKDAAVASAAHRALSALFPTQVATFDAALTASLAKVPDGFAEQAGVAVGIQAANAILALRADDGANAVVGYTPLTGPGKWQPTPPAFASALLPQWPDVKPFAMTSGSQFSPNAIPALTSTEYAAAFNEVKSLGAIDSATRTADQTNIAKFWANGAGTSTPPGHLNRLASIVATQRNLSVTENARLFALLNVALADAAIVAWDAKYDTSFWRPITGIHAGDTDGNAATTADTGWTPLLTTPPFPSYVSGHASFSGAAAAVLQSYFGTDSINVVLPSEDATVSSRAFTSFTQAAQESADSRLYGGIHWRFDNEDGLAAGKQLGEYVAAKFFQLQDRPARAGLVGDNLIIVGSERNDLITLVKRARDIVVYNRGVVLGTFATTSFQSLTIDARGGSDFVMVGNQVVVNATILGGAGNDVLFGGAGNDRIEGGDGDDWIYGLHGADSLDGGDGNDWLFGGLGSDTIVGGRGRNRIFAV